MTTYFTRRLLQSLVVLLGVSFVVFFILHLTGDPALVLLPPDASPEDVRRFREAMGFNDPFFVQYGRFLGGALRGDFGQSIRHGESAFHLVVERMPATFELAGAALADRAGPWRFRRASSRRCAATACSTTSRRWWRCSDNPCRRSGSASCLFCCSRSSSTCCRRPAAARSSTWSCRR
jgi:hypothetical protein